jgi:hypothetical protein
MIQVRRTVTCFNDHSILETEYNIKTRLVRFNILKEINEYPSEIEATAVALLEVKKLLRLALLED